MKKKLEKEYLCESLRGRVKYQLDVYSRYGSSGNCITVVLDDQPLLKAGFMYANAELLRQGVLSEGKHIWDIPMENRSVYDDEEFFEALSIYRNQSITESVNNGNPLVFMFALLDQRVGKRTLRRLMHSARVWPEWLRDLYHVRCIAEGIRL